MENFLHYTITEKEFYKQQNSQNYEQVKKLLEEVGVMLRVENGELTLSVVQEHYDIVKKRNAGRHRNILFHQEGDQKDYTKRYDYADIVFMMQTMTDKEICESTGIPQATFYRHKKIMKESKYYKSLNMNRLKDLEYLQSVNGNVPF
ncbi:hypothetical protein [uncultured Lactobacillus sp.]|uniref:hypothetical protein n=1 Tax=uncultured Lactobacillus sp. TaxID=153152 RepID=UPI002624FC9D|nr:hypothetical protein [uncultured Lactobacillus sp.]